MQARDDGGLDAKNHDALRSSLEAESQDFHALGVGSRVRQRRNQD